MTTRPASEKFVAGQGWVFDAEKSRASFEGAHVDANGVVRWNSNNSVPFDDMLEDWASRLGITSFNMEASRAAREKDNAKFFAEYRKAQRGRKPSAEEMFEMRANFEPGTVVVDVITGRRTRL
jgi:hypothetical protein